MANGSGSDSVNVLIQGLLDVNTTTINITQELRKLQKSLPALKLMATLDGQTSLTLIVQELKKMQTQIPALKLKVELDSKSLEGVKDLYTKLQQQISQTSRNQTSAQNQSKQATQENINAISKEIDYYSQLDKVVDRYKVKKGKLVATGTTELRSNDAYNQQRLDYNATGELSNVSQMRNDTKQRRDDFMENLRLKRLGEIKNENFSLAGLNYDQAEAQLNTYVQATYGAEASVAKLRREYTKTGQEVWKFQTVLKTGKDTYRAVNSAVDESTQTLRMNETQVKKTLNRNLSFFEQFKNAASKALIWAGAMGLLYAPLHSLTNGIKSVVDLDSAMVGLKKVTDETKQTYQDFGLEAGKIGKTVARTAVDVVKATTDFARLGFSLQQSKVLATNSLLLANVGDMDVTQASAALISAVKGFGIEVDNAGKNVQKVIDVYNEVGNNFAITSEGIAEAVRRSASSMKEAGNSLEQTVALITAANAVVQDPETVGTALKTVSMRLRGITEDGGDAADTIPTLEKSFKAIGLSLKKDNETFKSTFEILQDLSKVWGRLSDIQKADILEKVAGKQRGNIVAGLLNNWKDAEKSLQSAQNSMGSAAKENATSLDSVQAKLRQFDNAVQQFWQTMLNSDGFKTFIELGTKAVEMLTALVDRIGSIPVSMFALTAAFVLFNREGMFSFTSAFNGIFNLFGLFSKQAGVASIAVKAFSSTAPALAATGAAATGAAGGVGLFATALSAIPFAIIITALGLLAQAWMRMRDANAKATETREHAVELFAKNKSEINELIKRYEELSKIDKLDLSTKDFEELVAVKNKLAQILPGITIGFDNEGNAILRSAEAAKEHIKVLTDLDKKMQDSKINNFYRDVSDALFNYKNTLQDVVKYQQEIDDRTFRKKMATSVQTPNPIGLDGMGAGDLLVDWWRKGSPDKLIDNAIIKQGDSVHKVNEKIQEGVYLLEKQLNIRNKLANTDEGFLENYRSELITKKYGPYFTNNEDGQQHLKDQIGKYMDLRKIVSTTRELMELPVKYDQGETFTKKSQFLLSSVKEQLKDTFSDDEQKAIMLYITQMLDAFSKSLFNAVEMSKQLKVATQEFTKEINTFASDNKDLADAIYTVNRGESLSYETIIKLIDKHQELIDGIYVENGEWKIHANILIKLGADKEKLHEEELTRRAQDLDNQAKYLEQTAANILQEIGLREELNNIKEAGIGLQLHEINVKRQNYTPVLDMNASDKAGQHVYVNGPYLKTVGVGLDGEMQQTWTDRALDNQEQALFKARDAIEQWKKTRKTADELWNMVDSAKKANIMDLLGRKDTNGRKNKFEPYVLNDYEHLDKAQEQIIKMNEQYKKLHDNKVLFPDGTVDKESMAKFKEHTMLMIEAYRERQRLAHEERKRLDTDNVNLKNQFSGMAESDDKNDLMKKFDSNRGKIDELKLKWWDFAQAIQELTIAAHENKIALDKYQDSIEKLKNTISESSLEQSKLKDYSVEYRNEIYKQIDANQQMVDITQKEIVASQNRLNMLKEQYNFGDLLEPQKKALIGLMDEEQSKLKDLTSSQKEYTKAVQDGYKDAQKSRQAWVDKANELADKVIESMRKAIEKQRDEEVANIEKVIDGYQKAHDKRMKMLDDEMKKFEDNVNEQIRLIDRESEQQDFDKNLSKEQQKRDEIKRKIDALAMDDSIEARTKKADLEKQLADQEEKIQDMLSKREKDQRKQALQDTLEQKRTESDVTKKTEDQKLQDFLNSQQEKKDKIEHDAKELLDNEMYWNEVRMNILRGNIDGLKAQLNGYWKTFTDIANENTGKVGRDINANLSLANDLLEKLGEIGNFDWKSKPELGSSLEDGKTYGEGNSKTGGSNGTGKNNSGSGVGAGNGSKTDKQIQDQLDEQSFIKNKVKYWDIMMQTGQENSSEQQQLAQANDKIRQAHPGDQRFANFTRDDLVRMNAYGLGDRMTSFRKYIRNKLEWETADEAKKAVLTAENAQMRAKPLQFFDFTNDDIRRRGFDKFDTGGYTGNWGTNSGKLAMLHQKELVLNAKDTENFLSVTQLVRGLIPMLKSIFVPQNKETNTGTTNQIDIHIGSVIGDKNGAETFISVVTNRLKGKGVNI